MGRESNVILGHQAWSSLPAGCSPFSHGFPGRVPKEASEGQAGEHATGVE